MTLLLPISASELLDAYEQSLRENPETAIRMVMWLMIYDELQVTWARDFLEAKGIFAKPEDETIRANQRRKVHRLREAAEKSTGLPGRGKKGASDAYHRALSKWRALNPRPTKEQLLAGWSPKPIDLGDSPSSETTAIATPLGQMATSLGQDSTVLSPTAMPDPTEVQEPSPDETALEKPRRQGVPKVPDFSSDDFQPAPRTPMDIPITAVQGLDDSGQSQS